MSLYLDSGYLNWEYINNLGVPFIFIVGGRGTGKTYGDLMNMYENKKKFMYMRRTQSQADIIKIDDFNPFKKLNDDNDWNVSAKNINKYVGGFYDLQVDENGEVLGGKPIGYSCALSTIANIRGFDASDVNFFIYDEFIPEQHEKRIKGEASALFNSYETINRNRELNDKEPLIMHCLSNSNDLGNPIFLELGLVRLAEKMRKNNREIHIDKKKKLALIILKESPISERKSTTALYNLTEGTEFKSMSIDNSFSKEERGRIKSMNIKEFYPIVCIGDITVYRHKSRQEYYVTTHKLGSPPVFGVGEIERKRFRRSYTWLWQEYLFNNIIFEEYLCEILLTKYFE